MQKNQSASNLRPYASGTSQQHSNNSRGSGSQKKNKEIYVQQLQMQLKQQKQRNEMQYPSQRPLSTRGDQKFFSLNDASGGIPQNTIDFTGQSNQLQRRNSKHEQLSA
jgi:hypothetical protein